jgi:hypothetical protein
MTERADVIAFLMLVSVCLAWGAVMVGVGLCSK